MTQNRKFFQTISKLIILEILKKCQFFHEKVDIYNFVRMQKRLIISLFRRNLQNFERNESGGFWSHQGAWGTEFDHFFLKFSNKLSIVRF